MRAARIENEIVADVWEVPALDCYEGITLIDAGEAGIGWTYANGVFTPPPKSLADAIAEKLRQIEHDRDAACIASVGAHARTWQADKTSQELLGQAITLASAGLPLPAEWRDADNNNMAITTIGDLLVIAGAIAYQAQAAYATSWMRKAAVDAATTAEEVDAA